MRKNYRPIILILLALSFIFFPQYLPAQTTAANLSFKNLEGTAVNLADFKGRVVVISFSAKGIPLTQIELPQLDRLAAKYANQPVSVLWISTNSAKVKTPNYATNDDLRQIANQYPRLTVLRDAESAAYHQIGADTLPTIIIFDQTGKQIGKPQAGIDPQANLVGTFSQTINNMLTK